jgi:hypothetical protein
MIKKNKFIKFKNKTVFFVLLILSTFLYSQSPPSLTAEGRQAFCVGNPIKIVTNFSITDIDDTTIEAFFIQISTGYQVGLDQLDLSGTHPNILSTWNANEGKLTLISAGSGTEMLFSDLERAVKEVVFTTTATNIISEKFFSLSIDDANYLPATDHFYIFISNVGITWTEAKTAAEKRPLYYGRQGYLATLTSQIEANFAGKQASGAGWIGGSDNETEGVWKWVTGPEAGVIFWNGAVSGSSPNYVNWNNNEPNNSGGNENYAHITDPSIGIRGAWNDLPNEGGSGNYEPKGYIVEYGEPGDPLLNIVATTSIYIPQILSITDAVVCESGSATITTTSSEGEILWFDASTGGIQLATGTSYTTSSLTTTTIFYATVSVNGCTTLQRTPVTVTVSQRPTITSATDDLICSGTAVLRATTSAGQIDWYSSLTSTTPIFTGLDFTTPI